MSANRKRGRETRNSLRRLRFGNLVTMLCVVAHELDALASSVNATC